MRKYITEVLSLYEKAAALPTENEVDEFLIANDLYLGLCFAFAKKTNKAAVFFLKKRLAEKGLKHSYGWPFGFYGVPGRISFLKEWLQDLDNAIKIDF
jgi:hypothetical protein